MRESNNTAILQFPDLRTLWAFTQTLSTKHITITTWNKTLTFKGSKTEIVLAISVYGAKIYKEQEVRVEPTSSGYNVDVK